MAHVNSHSTSAVNNIGHSVVDFGRSPSPAVGALSSRSHSPLTSNYFIYVFFFKFNEVFLLNL